MSNLQNLNRRSTKFTTPNIIHFSLSVTDIVFYIDVYIHESLLYLAASVVKDGYYNVLHVRTGRPF